MAGALTKAGRYQIVSELGRGSMGVVYQGFDPVIGRTVAIKTMLTEGLAPAEFEDFKARFQREAQAAGVLAHPNIVTVYDFGEDSGVLYLAMEFLEGKSLQDLVEEQGILPVETIVPMYEQVCSALDHAHSHKIVHRDVKPANIMILESGLVKVTDFGIAKMMSMGMTQAGQILGTPNYMSPEQVKGRQVDGRSDIFSLGVILYELVTGEKPFGGQNITTVIYKIINENPIPPRELDATIHPGLSYVIQRALAKNPDERYQTCRELAEDLKNFKTFAGATAPSATVIVRVPPIAAAETASAPPPQAVQAPPPPAPMPVEKPRARPLSVQVIPPHKPQPAAKSPVLWVLLALLAVGSLLGSYFFYFQKRLHAPKVGNLIVNSNVMGARIRLDGRSDPGWVTPYTFADLPVGSHAVVMSKEGYPDVQQSVTVEEGKTGTLNITLSVPTAPAGAGTLVVKSNVTGAGIILDGKSDPSWITPYTFIDVAVGSHAVVVSKPGYTESQESVTVEEGQTATLDASLTAAPSPERSRPSTAPRFGQLVVTSSIPGAKISIDSKSESGWVTPYTFRDLAAGTHSVVISKEGYGNVQHSITIEGGRTATISANLTLPTGEISIATTPPGVEVFIDGQFAGRSPVQRSVGLGQHTYTLRQAGKEVYNNTFEIKFDGHMVAKKVDLGGGPAAPTGIVEVRTIPSGGTVYADGKAVGATTPTNFRLSAGRHTLTISLSGFQPLQKEVDVPADGSIAVNERLSPQ